MAEKRFTSKEQTQLAMNENVLKVSENSITYKGEFKVHAVQQNLREGKSPSTIFVEAGFDLETIGRSNPRRCLNRWRTVFNEQGINGLMCDRRGLSATGRPLERELTVEEKLQRAEARIKYLEGENELLKKLDAIERSVVSKPSDKYQLIHSIILTEGNSFTINLLCEIAEVSRSGYYKWLENATKRAVKEREDYEQHLLIKKIFLKKKRKAGWRVIKMELERQKTIMNHKKIRRLMKKFGLIAQVRRKNPYKQILKATQEHSQMPNILNRNFSQTEPFKAFGTDITYLRDGNGQRLYLSVLRDIASGEVIAHYWSRSLGLHLSLEIIKQAVSSIGKESLKSSLIHSDQGFHYTHPTYITSLKDLGIVQSMSRKGNCIDNAPTESFFGHLKDELDLRCCFTNKQVGIAIDDYIYYYNNCRYQWTKNKMAPVEYRNHLLVAC